MEILRLVVILLLIILIIVIGKAYVNEEKFAVLTGNITLTDGAGNVDINYPSGYNKDNCVVISAGINILGTGMDFLHSNSHYVYVRLKTNNITLYCDKILNSGSNGSKPIKIVLMKIS